MRNYLVLILFVLVFKISYSQFNEKELSFTFENVSHLEALQKINSDTDYQIYYLQNWFTDSLIQKNIPMKI